jgi:predicted DNA-binding protein with PD1-like motif
MPVQVKAKGQETVLARLDFGSDLFDSIQNLAREHDVRLGTVTALGAVKKARIAFYAQDTRKYEETAFDEPLEITSLVGNLSMRDGQIALHAHMNLGDHAGRVIGGHLVPGTEVFACEVMMTRLEGPALTRVFDETTGLWLWKS